METLSRWLVQQPAHILLVAVASLALWVFCGATILRKAPKANVLWAPAVLWLAYAGWEASVLAKTPEADIRVDHASDTRRVPKLANNHADGCFSHFATPDPA